MRELLLDTVLFLARYKPELQPPGPELLSQAGNRFRPFEESALEKYFDDHPSQGKTSEEDAFVFLPMVTKHRLLPVLNLDYKLDRDWARLQVVLFLEKGVKNKTRSFGYRFDPPEGPGRHNYWHVQPLLKMKLHDKSTIPLPGMLDGWRPPETPAFPIDAEKAVDLSVCLMVSLYGLQEAERMQADGFENRLGPRLGKLRSRPTPGRP